MIDTDGDGYTDTQEYVCGTSPDDPAAALAITDLTFNPDGKLGWRSVAGRTYDVLCSTNLAEGFFAVLTDIKGQSGRSEVTLPVIGTALLAGGLLAFALSFDEVIVTTFTAGTQQTLPIWILANLRLPNQRPLVNVVAVVMILVSAIPVYFAQRLTSESVPQGRT